MSRLTYCYDDVVMLSDVMLSVVMLSVVMLIVVAPLQTLENPGKPCQWPTHLLIKGCLFDDENCPKLWFFKNVKYFFLFFKTH